MGNTSKLSYFKGTDTPGLVNETIGQRLAQTVAEAIAIYFDTDREAGRSGQEADGQGASTDPRKVPGDGADPGQQGDRFMLQSHYADLTQQGVARNFGTRFAEAVFELVPGNWEGPVQSGYGLHLVRVEGRKEAYLPPFEEVRSGVRDDFMSNRRNEVDELFYERLRESYTITIEEVEYNKDMDSALFEKPAVE